MTTATATAARPEFKVGQVWRKRIGIHSTEDSRCKITRVTPRNIQLQRVAGPDRGKTWSVPIPRALSILELVEDVEPPKAKGKPMTALDELIATKVTPADFAAFWDDPSVTVADLARLTGLAADRVEAAARQLHLTQPKPARTVTTAAPAPEPEPIPAPRFPARSSVSTNPNFRNLLSAHLARHKIGPVLLADLYHGYGTVELCAAIGLSSTGLYTALDMHGIPIRGGKRKLDTNPPPLPHGIEPLRVVNRKSEPERHAQPAPDPAPAPAPPPGPDEGVPGLNAHRASLHEEERKLAELVVQRQRLAAELAETNAAADATETRIKRLNAAIVALEALEG